MSPQPGRADGARNRRAPGVYWVRVRGASHDPQPGRFITEPWVGITPWRVDGRWYGEREIEVLSERIEPPEEPPAA